VKLFYHFGTAVLFLGLLWMFLPHAAHAMVLHEESESHITHTLQGVVVVIVGLAIMIVTERKIKAHVVFS